MESLSDLVAAARRGDAKAYTALVKMTRTMAFGVAAEVLGERQAAEDAVQQAYLRAFRRLDELSDGAAFPAWLRRIVLTVALNVRRTHRRALLRLDDVPESHWQFLEDTVPFLDAETDFFVHAGVDPRRPLDEQPDDVLYWEKLDETAGPHVSGKRMICGHTSQHSGTPLNLGHAVCIDTWVYGAGWLTALDVESGRCWQANEYGTTRTGSLS